MRRSEIARETTETDVTLALNLDGTGKARISTGCGFFDHMMILFASHSCFDIEIECHGDTVVDYHHTVEDVGICLGDAFAEAMHDTRGITRYGNTILPMDESLIMSAVDISGRGILRYDVNIPTEKVGNFDTELCAEFWNAFSRHAGVTLHIKMLNGENSHHIIEGCFKSVAHSLRAAVKIDPSIGDRIPSTKGTL